MLQALKHPWLQDDETIKKVEELWQGQKLLPTVANGSDQVWVEFYRRDGYRILDLDSFGVSDIFFCRRVSLFIRKFASFS